MSCVEALPPTKINLEVPICPLFLLHLRAIISRSTCEGANHALAARRASSRAGVRGRAVGRTRHGGHPTSALGGDVAAAAL
jgi:hypothetical protein